MVATAGAWVLCTEILVWVVTRWSGNPRWGNLVNVVCFQSQGELALRLGYDIKSGLGELAQGGSAVLG